MTKYIELTQGQVAIVDDDDFERLSMYKWCARWEQNTKSYYAATNTKGVFIYMARFIMDTPKGLICDHINHDTLDNRKENLRNVTTSVNQQNRRNKSKNSTNVEGVHKHGGGYRAFLSNGGYRVTAPTRKTIEDAETDRSFLANLLKRMMGERS